MQPKKTYIKIMMGQSDNNINFNDLQNLLVYLGFINKNINGDHFIYYYGGVPEIINIQPIGDKAKNYQIKQIRNFLKKYNITIK